MKWSLVQRADADERDRARADELAERLASSVIRTEDPSELDEVLDDVGGGLVVCGGDGSLHHAANALVRTGSIDRITLAVLPAGTGNDYAGHLGLPEEPELVAALVTTGRTQPVDLIRIRADEGGLGVAVNAVHTGIGVEAADRAQEWKDTLGDLAYPVGSLQAGFSGDGWTIHVVADGQRLDRGGAVLMASVTSGSTIGGGRPISPEADERDGLLDVMLSHDVQPAARAAFALALTRGTHVDRSDVIHRTARSVTFEGGPMRLNVDGELWAEPVTRPRFDVMPAALRIVVPGS